MKFLFGVAAIAALAASATGEAAATKYDYPEYCFHYPSPAETRAAPPLADAELASRLILDHVHLIFRHGARTPMPLGDCWADYKPQWDCDYFESVQGGLGTATYPTGSHELRIQKIYDSHAADNILGGTCQCEQLLTQGAQQHQRIGRLVAENYLISDSARKLPRPGTPSLLSTSLKLLNKQLFLRSTESMRTTHSLLNQLQSMLAHFIRRELLGAGSEKQFDDNSAEADDPKAYPPRHRQWTQEELDRELNMHSTLKMSIPPLNTMDNRYDTLAAMDTPCPLLVDIAKEIVASSEFQKIRAENQAVISQWQNLTSLELHDRMWPVKPFDCALSHVCADQWAGMPEGLHPESTDAAGARQYLTDLENAATREMHGLYALKDAVFSRFGIAGLIVDLRRQMLLTLQAFVDDPKRTRLHMWSTHDDGVGPLLHALLPGWRPIPWVPYASLVTIEVYRLPTDERLQQVVAPLFPYDLESGRRQLEEKSHDAEKSHDEESLDDSYDGGYDDEIISHVAKDEAKLREEELKKSDKDSIPPFTGYFVRLVYNGRAVTQFAAGCDAELCRLDDFFQGTTWSEAANRLCVSAREQTRRHASFIPAFPYIDDGQTRAENLPSASGPQTPVSQMPTAVRAASAYIMVAEPPSSERGPVSRGVLYAGAGMMAVAVLPLVTLLRRARRPLEEEVDGEVVDDEQQSGMDVYQQVGPRCSSPSAVC